MTARWSSRWGAGLTVGVVSALGAVGPAVTRVPQQAAPATPPAATQPSDKPALSAPPEQIGQERQPAAGDQAARQRLLSGLIGSKHDFTDGGKRGRDLCLPCHTPHLTDAPVPRLDRRVPATQPLRPYASLQVELDGWSLLCLGCHDGVTARDVYSLPHATSVTGRLAGSRLGTVGLRSHPVGIAYPVGREDYHPAAAVEATGLLLPGGRLQCTTCHDAHNTRRYPGMLRVADDRSRLCLTCHRL